MQEYLDIVVSAVYTLLALLALRQALRRPTSSAWWLSATFGSLSVVTILARALPEDPSQQPRAASFVLIGVLLLFPYCMFCFASSFRRPPRWLSVLAAGLTVFAVAAMFAAGPPPELGAAPSARYLAFTSTIALQWGVLLLAAAGSLWLGGRRQPPVASRRMRYMAVGAVVLAAALLLAIAAGGDGRDHVRLELATALLSVVSALLFYVGFAPPPVLRQLWRSKAQEQVRAATIALMSTERVSQLGEGYLPAVADLVGARAAAIVDPQGVVLAASGVSEGEVHAIVAAPVGAQEHVTKLATPRDHATQVLRLAAPFGETVVLTTSYTPFFGTEELDLLRSINVVLELALDRFAALERQEAIARRLEELNDLKNEFVAVVAHDLRSPMSVISGFARTLDDQWDVMAEEQKRDILRVIAGNTESLAALVEDVLHVARIESGELSYEMRAFDVAQLARRVVDDLSTLADRPLTLDVDPAVGTAWGDEDRNWQVLTNLVTNALKFSAEDQPVLVQLGREGERIRISVEDRGMGIRPEDQARVFEKFSRIDPVDRSRRTKGSGLGLFISRTIVEAHGSQIELDSQPGRGSVFSYSLPLAEEPT